MYSMGPPKGPLSPMMELEITTKSTFSSVRY